MGIFSSFVIPSQTAARRPPEDDWTPPEFAAKTEKPDLPSTARHYIRPGFKKNPIPVSKKVLEYPEGRHIPEHLNSNHQQALYYDLILDIRKAQFPILYDSNSVKARKWESDSYRRAYLDDDSHGWLHRAASQVALTLHFETILEDQRKKKEEQHEWGKLQRMKRGLEKWQQEQNLRREEDALEKKRLVNDLGRFHWNTVVTGASSWPWPIRGIELAGPKRFEILGEWENPIERRWMYVDGDASRRRRALENRRLRNPIERVWDLPGNKEFYREKARIEREFRRQKNRVLKISKKSRQVDRKAERDSLHIIIIRSVSKKRPSLIFWTRYLPLLIRYENPIERRWHYIYRQSREEEASEEYWDEARRSLERILELARSYGWGEKIVDWAKHYEEELEEKRNRMDEEDDPEAAPFESGYGQGFENVEQKMESLGRLWTGMGVKNGRGRGRGRGGGRGRGRGGRDGRSRDDDGDREEGEGNDRGGDRGRGRGRGRGGRGGRESGRETGKKTVRFESVEPSDETPVALDEDMDEDWMDIDDEDDLAKPVESGQDSSAQENEYSDAVETDDEPIRGGRGRGRGKARGRGGRGGRGGRESAGEGGEEQPRRGRPNNSQHNEHELAMSSEIRPRNKGRGRGRGRGGRSDRGGRGGRQDRGGAEVSDEEEARGKDDGRNRDHGRGRGRGRGGRGGRGQRERRHGSDNDEAGGRDDDQKEGRSRSRSKGKSKGKGRAQHDHDTDDAWTDIEADSSKKGAKKKAARKANNSNGNKTENTTKSTTKKKTAQVDNAQNEGKKKKPPAQDNDSESLTILGKPREPWGKITPEQLAEATNFMAKASRGYEEPKKSRGKQNSRGKQRR